MSTASAAERPTGQQSVLARRPLTFYFLIAFAISWMLLAPGLLIVWGVLDIDPRIAGLLATASLLGPILSGFVMTAATEGDAGVRDWLLRIVRWRVGVRWYLFALFGIPAVVVLCTLIRPGALASFDISAQPFSVAYLTAFISMALIGGPLLEEPGWTGFAQPRLQRLYGPLAGGLVLGSLWALWHLPGFLIPSQNLSDIPPRGTVLQFVVFCLALIGLRLVIMWIVNNTRDSVFMAILAHASWNTFYTAALIGLFPAPAVLGSYINLTIAAVAMALVLIVVTRGRLGYRPDNATPRVR